MTMSNKMMTHVGRMENAKTSKEESDAVFETAATFMPMLAATTMVINQPSQEHGVHPQPYLFAANHSFCMTS